MRKARPNTISPKDRIAVGRQDAADLLSICAGTFDRLVKQSLLPKPTYNLHRKPMWDVEQLRMALAALSQTGDKGYVENEDCPEPEV
jgi:hypothetical protein